MKNRIKQAVQKPMIASRHKEYEARVASQTVPYEVWVEGEILKAQQFATDYLLKNGRSESLLEEYQIIASRPKGLVEFAEDLVRVWLALQNKEELPDIIYADETGWLKPDYSPQLLLSQYYFGNIVIVKRSLVDELLKDDLIKYETETMGRESVLSCFAYRNDKSGLYEHLLNLCMKGAKVAHMKQILYRTDYSQEADQDMGFEDWFEDKKKEWYRLPEDASVSIVIPSKDNPRILSRCIHSIWEQTDLSKDDLTNDTIPLEIIVVDNGSCEENKALIEQMRNYMDADHSFRYYYERMPFNFSRMCNKGARLAKGNYLVFLNDDIEVGDSKWLKKMLCLAAMKDVGAVGSKLYYPGDTKVQHMGISNLHIGPAHKAQFQMDVSPDEQGNGGIYHRYNCSNLNVCAVTAANLLVSKKIYEQTKGFDEEMEVAFNDVEFCFQILELGYRNVCCNTTWMYHYESLSRGADSGIDKVSRLHRERDLLYSKHPQMWGRDPYFNPRFADCILDHGYTAKNRFDYQIVLQETSLSTFVIEPWMYNDSLYMGVEFAGSMDFWLAGPNAPRTGTDYYIQGWSYAVTVDNSRYDKNLVLYRLCDVGENLSQAKNQTAYSAIRDRQRLQVWKISAEAVHRPDLAEMLPFIDRPALSGVCACVDGEQLEPGIYLIGYLWEDACSRQKLCGFTAETIVIQ